MDSTAPRPENERHVLVVDDEPHIREPLAMFLRKQGFDVLTASDGTDAAAKFATRPFFLVISDVHMPGMSGLDLLATVRRRSPDVDVVMMTGDRDLDQAIESIRFGAYDYFKKPFDLEDVRLTVDRVVEKRRLQRSQGAEASRAGDAAGRRVLLRHAADTVAYRGARVLAGAPAAFGEVRAGEGTRTAAEILSHVGDLLDWSRGLAAGRPEWREAKPSDWDGEVARFHEAARALDSVLAGPEPLGAPPERVLQGPIADALTHIGQLALLRRLAGAPVEFENYYKAEIGPPFNRPSP